jgi:hypothetical protein
MRLVRAREKCERLERELRKCPDFQLYLLSKSRKDRARMELVLMQIPSFKLWHLLMNSIVAIEDGVIEPSATDASHGFLAFTAHKLLVKMREVPVLRGISLLVASRRR